MTTQQDPEQSDEQKLADILSLLNPPQQDYDVLADEALSFLNKLPDVASVERVLTAYFELFASGYALWQQTYDYPRIHEYFYGGYLKAKKIGDGKFPELIEMLEQMTKAMIAYTDCENALINGNPQSLLQSSTQAKYCGEEAQKKLSQALGKSTLEDQINKYLQMNLCLWQGLHISAQGYLDVQQGKALSSDDQSKMEALLGELKPQSHELFSELNAHYSFVQRHSRFREKINPSIRVKQGHLFLRAIGYIGEKEVAKLFEQFQEGGKTDRLLDRVQKSTKLPVKGVRASYLMDIFETALGKKYLDQLIFDLSLDDSVLSCKMDSEEKEHAFDLFHICIGRLGVISVEFGLPLEDVTVSHIRTLESLIGPHAGRLKFVWKWEDDPMESKADFNDARYIDFVEYFLYSQQWFKTHKETLSQERVTELTSMLEDWEKELCHLADLLERHSANAGEDKEKERDANDTGLLKYFRRLADWLKRRLANAGKDEDKEEKRDARYDGLLTYFRQMYNSIQSYQENTVVPADPNLTEIAHKIPVREKTFGQLMDIADLIITCMQESLKEPAEKAENKKDIMTRMREFLKKPVEKAGKEKDIRYLSAFDRNTGWQSILECNQLVLVEDGEELDPLTEAQYRRIMKQPEFKGLAIQSREARSAIDDWIFVDMPQMRNLGPIRSHENDVLYVGTSKIFLWFPDDPDFLVYQYVETARLIGNIRTLVLTFNDVAKKQIDDLEGFLEELEKSEKDKDAQLQKNRKKLLELRNGIEVFHTHAERILDLLRAFTISKYQDHSELMKWMLQESKTSDLQISLERNIENLDRFHGYLTSFLQRRIEDRNQSNQVLVAVGLFILTFLSGLSALPTLYGFFGDFMNNTAQKGLLLGGMCFLLVVGGLIIWQRSKRV